MCRHYGSSKLRFMRQLPILSDNKNDSRDNRGMIDAGEEFKTPLKTLRAAIKGTLKEEWLNPRR